MNLVRGTFRARGDTVEIHPAYEEQALRIEIFGDTIERIVTFDVMTGEIGEELEEIVVFAATHYVTGDEIVQRAVGTIEAELRERLQYFEKDGKLLEAQRLRMRTEHDLEMLAETGVCSGIENYSRHLDGRAPGRGALHPARLLPQGLPGGDGREPRGRAPAARPVRRRPLPQGDAGRPRLPPALGAGQPAAALRRVHRAGAPVVFVSATPGPLEKEH